MPIIDGNNKAQLDAARSTDGGETWAPLDLGNKKPTNMEGKFVNILSSQGNFCNVLGVDNKNPNIVYGAGTDMYRSTDGGESWAWMTDWAGRGDGRAYVHADFHDFMQLSDGTILFGTDGGVFASSDAGTTFRSLNRTMQVFYSNGICVDPRNLDRIGVGAQDNGNSMRVQGTEWRETMTGDGFACAFHPTNPDISYMTTQNLSVWRSTDGGQSFQRIREGLTDAGGAQAIFSTSLIPVSASGAFRLYTFSRRKLWVTTDNGDTWAEASQDLPLSNNINDLTVSATAPNKMALVDWRRNILVSSDTGATWTKTGEVPVYNFNSLIIRIDPADTNRLFIASDTPVAERQRLFSSPDNGVTWTPISRTGEANGLPDVPINSFEVDPTAPNVYWAGTFTGLYRSGDGGQTWRRHGQGLPNVPVKSLAFDPNGQRLRAGTQGRGVWEVATAPGTEINLPVPNDLSNPVALFSFQPANPRPGESVDFTDESTGAPSAWTWDFGDGSKSTLPNPVHVFSTAGTFEVKLVITTGKGVREIKKPVVVSRPSTGTGDTMTYLLPILFTLKRADGTGYSTELTLTNMSGKDADVTFTAKGTAGGTPFEGTATYKMKPGQEVQSDAWAFLKGLGMSVPEGEPFVTLRVAAKGPENVSDFGAQARVTTPPTLALAAQQIKGRFGLAYPATPLTRGASKEAIIYGLQQIGTGTGAPGTRSNIGCVHAGGTSGNISLEVTYYDGSTGKAHATKDATTFIDLTPFEWRPANAPLASRGITTGYAVIRKTAGEGQFLCYGVLNDNVNGDGSYVPMVINDNQLETNESFVPVVLEIPGYQSEVTLANRSQTRMTAYLTLVLAGRPDDPEFAAIDLDPGQQIVIDNIMKEMRDAGIAVPASAIGSLLVEFEEWSDPEGTDEGLRTVPVNLGYVGVRTFSVKAGGRFGLAYGYLPLGKAADSSAYILGLQQSGTKGVSEGTRSNLAVINAGGVEDDDIEVTVSYFGPDGNVLGKEKDCSPCTLKPGEWKQFNAVLDGTRNGFTAPQAFARIDKTSGADQFYAYGILNDQLNDDGSFVQMTLP